MNVPSLLQKITEVQRGCVLSYHWHIPIYKNLSYTCSVSEMRRDTMQYYSYPLLSVQWIRYICKKLQLHAGSGGLFTAVLPDSYTVIILSL